MRQEFDQYRAEHPELESFPPYNFRAPEHAAEAEQSDRRGVSQGPLSYVNDLGMWLFASNFFPFLYSNGNGQIEGSLPPTAGEGQGQRPTG